MGNFSSKDGHGPTGPNLDMFHTPPTSPVTADPPTDSKLTLALAPPDQPIASALTPSRKKPLPRSDSPPTPSSRSDWKPPTPVTPLCSAIGPVASPLQDKPGSVVVTGGWVSVGRNGSLSSPTPRTPSPQEKSVAVRPAESPSSLGSSSVGSPLDQRWSEGDSGLSQSLLHGLGDDRGEMERLVEECRTSLGLPDSQDTTVTDVLRRLLSEVHSLRGAIKTEQAERGEWLQFQSDLQVAVTVADRLRSEAEEELTALRTTQRDTERELAAAQRRQKETEAQLATLGGELRESRQRTARFAQTQVKIETQAPITAQNQEEVHVETTTPGLKVGSQRGREREICRVGGGGGEGMEKSNVNEGIKNVAAEEPRTDMKGVAKRYLRNVTYEEKSGEEGRATNDTRRIVPVERSRSLSRLPVSSDRPTAQNGTSQSNAVSTAASTNKNLSQSKGKKSLDHHDSWSGIHTGKQEETLNKYNSALTDLPTSKSQDGFNRLLRRHGGSKRNSLLRWCQSRTQGYENIDITNFSSSWVDGLAFCAVYHTYLPSHIPYCTLSPESKKENLNIAFKTGENVGITQSLTVEEMLRSGGPDWQSVLGYVESMYRHFEM